MKRIIHDGEMGKRIQEYDWSQSELGPIETWPSFLINGLNLMLSSPLPMSLLWGPNSIIFYNDASIPNMGANHPSCFAQTLKTAFCEIFSNLQPTIDNVFKNGTSSLFEEKLFLTRNNFKQECYFIWSSFPLYDEAGTIVGVINQVLETTKRVLSERRMELLRELATKMINCRTIEESLEKMKQIFNQHKHDIPFSLFYTHDKDKNQLLLRKFSGFNECNSIPFFIPKCINISSNEDQKEENHANSELSNLMKKYYLKKENYLIEDLEQKYGSFLGEIYEESPKSAFLSPIISQEQGNLAKGLLIIGVIPRRQIDYDYREFLELISLQVSRSIDASEIHELKSKQIEMLDRLDKSKTIFFNNVSHEFRTPLTLMINPLEDSLIDTKDILSAQQYERQKLIHFNSLRLLKLVNALLDFSRIEEDRMKVIFEPTNLSSLTNELTNMFKSSIENVGLEFILDIPDYQDLVYVDREIYEKILFNLLSNALKFTLEGSITVRLRKIEELHQMQLIVEDTGVGIPENEIDHIFERFYRVEGSKRRTYEGTGIGLSLLKELVKVHQGTIKVESKLEKGTKFIISFPLGISHLPKELLGKRESHEIGKIGDLFIKEASKWIPSTPVSQNHMDSFKMNPLPSCPNDLEIQSSKNVKILVIDDIVDMCNYIKSILSLYWLVEIANDGEEALKYIYANKENPPNLIISDIMMPKLNGFELVKKLKCDPKLKLIPIILLSARSGEEAKIEGLQTGVDDYLIKPFSTKELIARARIQIKLGNLRMELQKKVENVTSELAQKIKEQILIEKQRKVELALLAFEEKYHHLANLVPVGIFHINEEGYCSYINPAFSKITGWKLEDLQTKSWINLIHEEDRQSFLNEWSNNVDFNIALRLMKFDQEFFWAFIKLVVDNEYIDNSKHNFTGVLLDLTERKQLERARIEALEKEKEYERLRAEQSEQFQNKQNEFIDTICHELRNPLNGTLGSLYVIRDEIENLENILEKEKALNIFLPFAQDRNHSFKIISESLEDISECTVYQTIIINDVLNLSKLNAEKFKLEEVPCDLKKLIQSVGKMYSGTLKRKNLYLNLQFPENEASLRTKCDPIQLKQIIINFVSNAIKFTKTGGITISIVKSFNIEKDEFRISIKDSGIGMSEEEKNKLFERYWQANNQVDYGEKVAGTGLGLTISKKLIELMNGRIHVESEKGNGTCFSFNIICNALTQQEKDNFGSLSPSCSHINFLKDPTPLFSSSCINPILNSKKVLIVEDNLINQKVLSNILKKEGYNYSIANNGEEAFQKYLNFDFNIILMDIEMPILNGYEATKKIRQYEAENKKDPGIPIICLSGNSREEHKEKAISVGFNDYLTKPYQKDTLLQKIQTLISNQE